MLVIILMIIGIICIVVSCLLTGKEQTGTTENGTEGQENANHITDEYELNEEEVAILQKKVSDKISADVNDIIYNADNSLSTMTNEKMMALGDYAVTVCDEIEKNHKEVMFLYSMLNDKEKELKELTAEAERKASELKKVNELALDGYIGSDPVLEDVADEPEETAAPKQEPVIEDIPEPEADNTNEIILEMKQNGMSIMEIARELGLGVGEVKLVVDLYQGKAGTTL